MAGVKTWRSRSYPEHICQGVRHTTQQLVPILAKQPHLRVALFS